MKIFFIINGRRGNVSGKLIARFHDELYASGAEYVIVLSRSIAQSQEYVRQAMASGFDTLWMGGGDGTIHVLLNQARLGDMRLGVVPMGTVNAFARAMGIPLDPVLAVRFLLSAQPQPVNIGVVNGQVHFLCFAGIGLDGSAVHGVSNWFKRLTGRVAYVTAGLTSVMKSYWLVPFEVRVDDQPHPLDHGHSLILSNIRNYAGFDLFPLAHPCADSMEMYVFRGRRPDTMGQWALATRLHFNKWKQRLGGRVGHHQVRNFTVTSQKRMYLQLDGEAVSLGDDTRYEFAWLPGAVQVLGADNKPTDEV